MSEPRLAGTFVGASKCETLWDIMRERFRCDMVPVVEQIKAHAGLQERRWLSRLCRATDAFADSVCLFHWRTPKAFEHMLSESHLRCQIGLRELIGLPLTPQPLPWKRKA